MILLASRVFRRGPFFGPVHVAGVMMLGAFAVVFFALLTIVLPVLNWSPAGADRSRDDGSPWGTDDGTLVPASSPRAKKPMPWRSLTRVTRVGLNLGTDQRARAIRLDLRHNAVSRSNLWSD